MTIVEAAPLNISAVLLNGKATAIFASRPYQRVVRNVSMNSPVSSRVTIYRGTVGAFTFVTSHPQGSDQQYTNPFKLPAGQSLFVQWDTAPVPVESARAVITWMEEK